MTEIALKGFTTTHRRIKAGAPVGAIDDLVPHQLSDLKARGFVGEPPRAELSKSAPLAAPTFRTAPTNKPDGE